jgi:polysaccharide export outer membrane protein
VLGAVASPGNYELVGPTTLLQIIAQAKGLTPQAMNEIHILRQEKDGRKTKATVSMEDLNVNGNQSPNVNLQPNDVVIIPMDRMLTVYVYGEVKNPGALQFWQSKRITLLQAIAQAGGTTEYAKKSRVVIKRKDKRTGNEMKIPVDLNNMINGKTTEIVLEEGDIVIVP